MKKSALLLLIFILPLMLLAVSCGSNEFSGFKKNYVGTNVGNHITGTYELLNGTQTKTIKAEAGQTIVFTYTSTVEAGELSINVQDPDKAGITGLETNTSGTKSVTAEKSGYYRLLIKGTDNKGSFDISWEIK